ncbi:MAG: tail fiber domain-containing protein [Bacteroidota bacterium]
MKRGLITFVLSALLLIPAYHYGQVAVNTDGTAPDPGAMLDVKSTSRGLLVPRMTSAQRMAITSLANGLMVYDLTTGSFWYYTGTAWQEIGTGAQSVLSDNDGDTRIEVEQIPDEDIIRFTLAATERLSVRPGRLVLGLTNSNSIIGNQAGFDNITGSFNTALGYGTLHNDYSGNIDGSGNTAIGRGALGSFEAGNNNTALGNNALFLLGGGSNNIALGYNSMDNSSGNNGCIAIGENALGGDYIVDNNIGIGKGAGFESFGADNINLGNGAGVASYGMECISIGRDAGYHNYGNRNISVGIEAGRENYGEGNVIMGYQAGYNQGGNGNSVIIGRQAGMAVESGGTSGSVIIGDKAGFSINNGAYNCFIGSESGYTNTTGHSNIAIGPGALFSNTVKSNLVAIGDSALYNNGLGATLYQAFSNTGVGSKSLFQNTTGYSNSAFGNNALRSNTAGYANTATGDLSLEANQDGNGNTATGFASLYQNVSGGNNTASGMYALYYSISNNNTAFGFSAGDYSTFTSSTFLGAYAYPAIASLTNSMALGYNARVDASNKVVVGNTSVSSIGGYTGWTTFPSDSRYKKNVTGNVPGLEFITRLKPVTYTLDITAIDATLNKSQPAILRPGEVAREISHEEMASVEAKEKIVYSGFLAQEVEQSAKEIGYNFSGVDVPSTPDGQYGIRYAEFVVPLVKAVQELNVKFMEQQKMNLELLKTIEDLKLRNQELMQSIIETKNK